MRAPDGSGRLLDLDGSFYAVDPIAAELLADLSRGGRAEAVRAAARRHRVPEQQVAADLDALLAELPAGIGTAAPARRHRWADTFVPALLAALCRVRHPAPRTWALLAAARLCFAAAGWSRTLRWWTDLPARGGPVAAGTVAGIDRRVRHQATGSVLGHTCKERAVVCLAEARAAGLPAAVVLGLSSYPLATHSWCVVDDVVIGDHPDLCAAFQAVALHR